MTDLYVRVKKHDTVNEDGSLKCFRCLESVSHYHDYNGIRVTVDFNPKEYDVVFIPVIEYDTSNKCGEIEIGGIFQTLDEAIVFEKKILDGEPGFWSRWDEDYNLKESYCVTIQPMLVRGYQY